MKKRTNTMLLAGYGFLAVAGIVILVILRTMVTFAG
jgi:hypothetical protein